MVEDENMSYVIALAGNPNCGKTTLFNELTGSKQHVGNWPGVTVDKKEGIYKKDKEISILDLPGTYSLSPYSAEEVIARDYIVKERPDVVIDIVDGTNIERNLYLTLQIIETGVPLVIAMNMMDEVAARGNSIDCEKLSEIFGVPVVPIVARTGKNIDNVMEAANRVIKQKITPNTQAVLNETIVKAENSKADDIEAAIADLRYQYIGKVVKEAVKKSQQGYTETPSDKLDKILTNRIFALPIFAVVMYILFAATFSENFLFIKGMPSPGVWLAGVAETAWGAFAGFVEGLVAGASPWLQALVMDGIMEGIGAVIGFIPLVLVLYVLISFLEDSGYMARVAFVMDRIFRKFGLSGRSFIPLLMGFGCGVPAIMATRTLESEKDRKITTIVTGFMPCGAKLPIFAMFVSVFFADNNKTVVTYSLYMLSIIMAIIVSLLLNKFLYKSEASNFVMELPQYRIPTVKSIALHGFEKVKDFAIRAGTVIFISTIFIWLLSNFNINSFNGINKANSEDSSIMCEMDESFLAGIGNTVAPIFKPLGFGEWRPTVGVATGWIAKENVVATFAQLYDDDISEDISTKAGAYAYMVFNLLCMPCFAAVGTMKRELKTWKMTGFAISVQMATAYIAAFIIYNVGSMIR